MRNIIKYSQMFCNYCNSPFFILNTKKKQSLNGGKYCSHQCRKIGEFKKNICESGNGYKIISIIENGKIKQYYLHRILMEKWLGVKIKKGFHIHHKDNNRLNNNIENLQLIDSKSHLQYHNKKYFDKCIVNGCNLNANKRFLCSKHYLKGWKIKNFNADIIFSSYGKIRNRDNLGRFC